MNILIINPPIRLSDKPRHIPHGLAILANIIINKLKIIPKFIDVNAYRYTYKQLKEILQKINFDIVLTGGLAPTYKNIIKLSKLIKSINSEAIIIAGGYVAMPIPDLLLKNSDVDIVCTGEGEITIIEILQKFIKYGRKAKLSDIKGICYKNNTKKIYCTPLRPLIKDLDKESMLPAYELLPMDIYLSNPCVGIGKDIDMITIRGCPFRCSFCYQPWGNKPRAHSVEFIIKALKYLKDKYDINFVSFQDDEFMANLKRVKEFALQRNKHLPDLLWSCTGRANIVARNEEIVKLLRNSGCVLISFGFESGSQYMLEKMNKMQTIQDMEKTIKICRKYGLPIPASFIIGMPGETYETTQETLDFAIRNNIPLDSLMFATPYPGTEIFNFALKTKRIKNKELHKFMLKLGDARDFLINLTDTFTDKQLIERRQEMIDIAKLNYLNYISEDEIKLKMKRLYGDLLEKVKLDDKDIEHRAKHGGISIF